MNNYFYRSWCDELGYIILSLSQRWKSDFNNNGLLSKKEPLASSEVNARGFLYHLTLKALDPILKYMKMKLHASVGIEPACLPSDRLNHYATKGGPTCEVVKRNLLRTLEHHSFTSGSLSF